MEFTLCVSNLSDELATGLGAFTEGCTLAFVGEDPLSRGAVLQRELANDFTKICYLNVPD